MGNEKKCRKYRTGDKYWQLCIKKKIGIASYNNPNKLPNQSSEILNVWRYKNLGYLAVNFFFIYDIF